MNSFRTLIYERQGKIGYIKLNRPEQLNAIDNFLPQEIKLAVEMANNDNEVRVIVLSGEGKGFCGGYDLKIYAEQPGYNSGLY